MEQVWKKNLIKIDPYVPGEQPGDGVIKLNANENPYPPSPAVQNALAGFDAQQLRLYPDAQARELKQVIADYYSLKPTEVFIGNGSDDVLALAFQAFFNSSLPVLYPDLTYSFYPVWCELFGVKYENPPLDESFRINKADYYKPNGGIVFPNPNAPTGIGEGLNFLDDILSHNQSSVVIVDEAYADFSSVSSAGLIQKYDNLLVCGTLSKSRSLAGLRLGFALGSEELIAVLEAVKNSYNSYTVDSIAMALAAASFKDTAYFTTRVELIKQTRAWTVQELTALGFAVLPSEANFVLATHPLFSAKELFEYLKTQGIYVRYFKLPRLDNHLRITIGTPSEMQKLIDAIKLFK